MLPLTINIKDAYANGKDDEQKFIQNLSLFLCTFLKEHGQLVEKKVLILKIHRFSILFFIHFLWHWWGEFVKQNNSFLTHGYPMGIQRVFVMVFNNYANVSLTHFASTEISSSALTWTHCSIWKQDSSLLPKSVRVVHSLLHPRERTLGTRLSHSRSLRKYQHSLSILSVL